MARVLGLVTASTDAGPDVWQLAVLEGLGQGLQNSARPLPRLWEQPPPALREAIEKLRPVFPRDLAEYCRGRQNFQSCQRFASHAFSLDQGLL